MRSFTQHARRRGRGIFVSGALVTAALALSGCSGAASAPAGGSTGSGADTAITSLAVIAPAGTDLGAPEVPVLTPAGSKGLEFDAVVIVDPERIRAADPADLYVAMTRATQRLGVLEVAG